MRSLFPKNDVFFDLFNEAASNMHRAAELMLELCKSKDRREELVGALREVEHKGDRCTRKIMKMLATSFITPLDREDIHSLTSSLDNVVDYLDDAANSFLLLRVGEPIEEYKRQAELTVEAAKILEQAVSHMRSARSKSEIQVLLPKVYDIESEADGIYNRALARLFSDESIDTKELMKWKLLCDLLEDGLDECQAVANVIEMILLKSY